MDLDFVRGVLTAILFGLFLLLCAWAWSDGPRSDFERASRLPFDDSDGLGTREEQR
jgi:cbb3-type cytochrome oxidase subunit 3